MTTTTHQDAMLVLSAEDISALMRGRERDVIATVSDAYRAHRLGASDLPQSVFLRFPGQPQDRVIALPAYLGGETDMAGIKWIASFPNNLAQGRDRASAAIILNSAQTGQPLALLEGSLISAWRTAASAALAAATLHTGPASHVALIGTGLINFNILSFLRVVFPGLASCVVYDQVPENAERFRERAMERLPRLDVSVAGDLRSALAHAPLVSFATTAGTPYLHDPACFAPGSTVLHISLRDLGAPVILAADNVVDDIEHVCRAQTSIHLTAEQQGERGFIRCTLADVLEGEAPPRVDAVRPLIFSPFGLGVLDLALGRAVYDHALATERGTWIEQFLPLPWRKD
ncbi:MAG TPA: 2,3-diaminopropionate biosynthesis protein SbnB [Roseiflexaceae bacterium]|nr:2,3-diaminopropionate biosynthesis protein SbnB [Roseiflexaceae bacterium]